MSITQVEEDDKWVYKLKKEHKYYFQVQMEIFTCDVQYCDFIVSSPELSIIIRILKDSDLWNIEYRKTVLFHKKILLPELLGNFYSNRKRDKQKGRKTFTY